MKLIKEFINHMLDNWGGVVYLVFVMALGVLALMGEWSVTEMAITLIWAACAPVLYNFIVSEEDE